MAAVPVACKEKRLGYRELPEKDAVVVVVEREKRLDEAANNFQTRLSVEQHQNNDSLIVSLHQTRRAFELLIYKFFIKFVVFYKIAKKKTKNWFRLQC